jgi:RNA polymerase sigma-70 factor, ECF subfamily
MKRENVVATKTDATIRSSDEYLIKSIAAGDQAAMRILYIRHSARVLRFIIRFVPEIGRAEDLLSEVFIDVWRKADRFEGRSQVSTWILSIARFKSLTASSRRRDEELDESAVELIVDGADSPEQAVLSTDFASQLRTCLGGLSPAHREVIDLIYYCEKSVEEAAEIMRTPTNTVKTRAHYARKALAGLLTRHHDFDHYAVAA